MLKATNENKRKREQRTNQKTKKGVPTYLNVLKEAIAIPSFVAQSSQKQKESEKIQRVLLDTAFSLRHNNVDRLLSRQVRRRSIRRRFQRVALSRLRLNCFSFSFGRGR